MAPADGGICVEVVFCPTPGHTDLVRLQLAAGATLVDALRASGLLQRHALEIAQVNVGVWGRVMPLDRLLNDRDRVEIYRPLRVDPKEARRQRYRHQRLNTAGG